MEQPIADTDRTSEAFIRQVAHDLRASLNVVVSWAELVKAGQLPPEDVSRAGDTIVRHARHLSERLGVALDLWRLDSGLLTAVPRAGPVGAIVRAAVDDACRHFESRRVSCRIEVRSDGNASVDAPRLAQALRVLLTDAAANTPADHTVDVTLSADDGQVVIRIVGGGLVPDQMAFGRNLADTRATGQRRPFDFGLSLAKALVELNGGRLNVEPAEADRAAVVVHLPAAHHPQQ